METLQRNYSSFSIHAARNWSWAKGSLRLEARQQHILITQSMVAVESSGCTKCSYTEHTPYGCQQFLDMSGLQRRSFVKEKSLCYNCLRPGRGVNRCKSTYKCRQCKGNHHSLLHVQPNPQASGNLAQIAEGHSVIWPKERAPKRLYVHKALQNLLI